jgi:hypothetical protein
MLHLELMNKQVGHLCSYFSWEFSGWNLHIPKVEMMWYSLNLPCFHSFAIDRFRLV